MPGSSSTIAFATSNVHKAREARSILAEFGIALEQVPSKGTEIQADSLAPISEFAAREVSRLCGRPVIAEDSGLFIEELGGFPGPYSSYVYRRVGLKGFLAMLRELVSRSAVFMSSVSYCDPGRNPMSFEGRAEGEITLVPSGTEGFGFDPVFRPRDFETTLAEMTMAEKNKISHRGDSLRKFANWFLDNR